MGIHFSFTQITLQQTWCLGHRLWDGFASRKQLCWLSEAGPLREWRKWDGAEGETDLLCRSNRGLGQPRPLIWEPVSLPVVSSIWGASIPSMVTALWQWHWSSGLLISQPLNLAAVCQKPEVPSATGKRTSDTNVESACYTTYSTHNAWYPLYRRFPYG